MQKRAYRVLGFSFPRGASRSLFACTSAPYKDHKGVFHSIGCPVCLPPPRNEEKRPCPIDLEHSLGRPTVCLPETKWVQRPTHQPIKWSSADYLATFTRTRIIGKGNLFDFATIFTRLRARCCTGQRGNLLWKNWIASWFSFEVMSTEWLPFPETQVRHHWLAPK